MASFPSYHLDALLYDSARTAVYRARRVSDQQPVVLKVLRDTVPERLAAFKREYDVLRTLNLPGVVQAYGLEHGADAWIMVLEDFGGELQACGDCRFPPTRPGSDGKSAAGASTAGHAQARDPGEHCAQSCHGRRQTD